MRLNRRRFMETSALSGVFGFSGLSSSHRVTGENTAGGEERWVFETGSRVESSPTVVGGLVFFISWDHKVYALDADTGEETWRFDTGDRGFSFSSPNVIDGTVFISDGDRYVHALDADTGEALMDFDVGEVSTSPTVVDNILFVAGGRVFAFDVESGQELWRFTPEEWIDSSPTVVDRTLYVGSNDHRVYALDTTTGHVRWQHDTGGYVGSSPTVVDGVVYVGSAAGSVYALDADTGEERWSLDIGSLVRSSPTAGDGALYVGAQDGVYAIDLSTGEQEWRFETGDLVDSSPTIVGDRVFVGSWDHNVYALDAATGDEVWRFDTGDWITYSSPIVVDGELFVGSSDGNVYCLDAGIDGSSEGSRVNLGTLGHHHGWAEKAIQDPGEPGEIHDWRDLNSVRENLDGEYSLENDLTPETNWYDEYVVGSADGWDPIGTEDDGFTGVFNGNGHTIRGLDIRRPDETDVGLFRTIDGGTVTAIRLADIFVTGDWGVGGLAGEIVDAEVSKSIIEGEISGRIRVGGLVGIAEDSLIVESSTDATITADGSEFTGVGGLIGENRGASEVKKSFASGMVAGKDVVGGLIGNNTDTAVVTDCSATAGVVGDGFGEFGMAGGLVGRNEETATVTRSYATGQVDGIVRIGGLIGENRDDATVSESYATASVQGEQRVGGVVGTNLGQGSVTNCMANGEVVGVDRVGGLIGNLGAPQIDPVAGVFPTENTGSAVTDTEGPLLRRSIAVGDVMGEERVGGLVGRSFEESVVEETYWDTQQTGQTHAVGEDEGEASDIAGLLTAEMQGNTAVDNMGGLNFEDTWTSVTDPDGYPQLAWQTDPDEPVEETIEAEITGIDPPAGTFEPGDEVTTDVIVENTGTVEHTFFVGYGAVGPDGQIFDNDGTTGQPVTLPPGEQTVVSVTWIAEIEAPSGPYEVGSAVWKEDDIDELETRLDDKWVEDAFELENDELPGWASIYDPVTPEEWPFSHTSEIEVEHTPDRERLEGPTITTEVDRFAVDEATMTLTIDIDLPSDSRVKHLRGAGYSQILILFNSEDLTVVEDEVSATVDGATPRAVETASHVLTAASVASLGKGEVIRAMVEELAVQTAEAWASSRFTVATTPELMDTGLDDVAILHVDFSADWFPAGRDPTTFESFSLEATFTAESPIDSTELSVFFDLRAETVPTELDPTAGPPITAGFVVTRPLPIELRGELVVPVDDEVLAIEPADDGVDTTDEPGTPTASDTDTADSDDGAEVDRDAETADDGLAGFGIVSGLTALGGLAYTLRRRGNDTEGADEDHLN